LAFELTWNEERLDFAIVNYGGTNMNMEESYSCPHCGEALNRWEPAAEAGWDTDLYICENDQCAYFVAGRQKICDECEVNFGYRYCYNPMKDKCIPLAAWCGGELSLKKGRCAC
jgi:hypothetical protein